MKLITVTVAVLLIVALPLAADDAKAMFTSKCMPCHGADGSGNTPMGKKIGAKSLGSAEVQKKSDADLTKVITTGSGKMPSFKQLPPDQIAGLVKFIRGLAK
ncbi:MAG TPA: cytochrome c [Thermoanaerobaculia bacterium]|nr:cytochrome c [Thermoanaerobaculia bacterium]